MDHEVNTSDLMSAGGEWIDQILCLQEVNGS